MFDESQHLLDEEFGYEAFRFRCVRLWLREIPKGYRENYVIAAVFTGTNSKSSNFHFESDEDLKRSSVADTSREWFDATNYHTTGGLVFAPFFQTTPMIINIQNDMKHASTDAIRALYPRAVVAHGGPGKLL